jgi:hypothetical protein
VRLIRSAHTSSLPPHPTPPHTSYPTSYFLLDGQLIIILPLLSQTEKAYQKQDAIFIGRKRALGKNSRKVFIFSNLQILSIVMVTYLKGMRYFKSIGLGFKTPKTATEGSYVDKKCPFTGNVSIRGRILTGIVVSTKMKRTIVIRRDYLQYIKKYRRSIFITSSSFFA